MHGKCKRCQARSVGDAGVHAVTAIINLRGTASRMPSSSAYRKPASWHIFKREALLDVPMTVLIELCIPND